MPYKNPEHAKANAAGRYQRDRAARIEGARENYAANRAARIAGMAAYHAAHKKDIATRNAARYLVKRSEALLWQKEYYASHKAEAAVRGRGYRAANPEKYATSMREWQRTNADKVNATVAKRNAAKLQATPVWASKQKIDEFYYTADMLGMHTGDPHHVDHVVPLRSKLVCGLHVEHNLQVLTGLDNLKKGNRHWPDMP